MPTITITITAGGSSVGRTKTISGADLTNRFLPAYRALFPVMPNETPLTDDQVVQRWADYVLQDLKQHIRNYEATNTVIPPLDLT